MIKCYRNLKYITKLWAIIITNPFWTNCISHQRMQVEKPNFDYTFKLLTIYTVDFLWKGQVFDRNLAKPKQHERLFTDRILPLKFVEKARKIRKQPASEPQNPVRPSIPLKPTHLRNHLRLELRRENTSLLSKNFKNH